MQLSRGATAAPPVSTAWTLQNRGTRRVRDSAHRFWKSSPCRALNVWPEELEEWRNEAAAGACPHVDTRSACTALRCRACTVPAMNELVVFSHVRWDFVYQRPQQILSRLARRYRVLFVEEPKYASGDPRGALYAERLLTLV
jgi:hypothetical protein